MKFVVYIAFLLIMITMFVSCKADLADSDVLASDPELLMFDAKSLEFEAVHPVEEVEDTMNKKDSFNLLKILFPDAKKQPIAKVEAADFDISSHASATLNQPGLNFFSGNAQGSGVILRDFSF